MYLHPRMDVTGKRTVWSEENLPLVSTILAWARWAQAPVISSSYGAVNISGLSLFFVEQRFLCSWYKFPLDVWMLFGRCLWTRYDVNTIHVS